MKKIILTLLAVLILASCVSSVNTGSSENYSASSKNSSDNSSSSNSNSIDSISLDDRFTKDLKFSGNYNGKNFLTNNIGVVTLTKCIDGDKAHFKAGGTAFTARYLSIDTPESTVAVEPWGKLAAKVMCQLLTEAQLIVAEGNTQTGAAQIDSTGTRYLAYIWVSKDGSKENLMNSNLYMVEQALSFNRSTNNKYSDIFALAFDKAFSSKKKIHGESDPDFYYFAERPEVTTYELVADKTKYLNRKIRLTGYVSRIVGNSFYLCNDQIGDLYAGVFIFVGFVNTSYARIGMKLEVQGMWIYNEDYGYQITDVRNSELEDYYRAHNNAGTLEYIEINPLSVTGADVLAGIPHGVLISLSNVKLTTIPAKPETVNTGYSVKGLTSDGKTITLRVDKAVNASIWKLEPSDFGAVNDFVTVLRIISFFMDGYQVMVVQKADINPA